MFSLEGERLVWKINSRRLLQSRGVFFICASAKKALNLDVFHSETGDTVLSVAPTPGIFYAFKNKFSFLFAISEIWVYLCGVNSSKTKAMKDSTTFRGNIHYVFAEKLPAMYPGIEIEIKYAGCAYIDGDEVTLFEPISIAIGDGAYKNYPVPNGNGHFDWKTISNLKEAAIRAAWLQNNGLEFGRTMEEMLGRPEKNFIE